ncbi:MAG: hypothetical protein VR64_21840 [Desulfatitalea sp. BRH_c12]|nr:MAG: hypothetical protein VR64_21840 [Desulfatitalea sp. BRH_c12]
MNEPIEGLDESAERPSRTQKKKAAIALQKVGEQLVTLKPAQLDELALPPELHEAVVETRAMKSHGARRRQLQYIGSLMRHVDTVQLQQGLELIASQAHQDVRQFKQVEQWRDELAAGKQDRFDWLVRQFPAIDRNELLRLVGAAQENASAAEQRKASRALFRYLRRFLEQNLT